MSAINPNLDTTLPSLKQTYGAAKSPSTSPFNAVRSPIGSPEIKNIQNRALDIITQAERAVNQRRKIRLEPIDISKLSPTLTASPSERTTFLETPRLPLGSLQSLSDIQSGSTTSSPRNDGPQRPASQASGLSAPRNSTQNTPSPASVASSIAADEPSFSSENEGEKSPSSKNSTPPPLNFSSLSINTSRPMLPADEIETPEPLDRSSQELSNNSNSLNTLVDRVNSSAKNILNLFEESHVDRVNSSANNILNLFEESHIDENNDYEAYMSDDDYEDGVNDNLATTVEDPTMFQTVEKNLPHIAMVAMRQHLSEDQVIKYFPIVKAKIEEVIRKQLSVYYKNSALHVESVEDYLRSLPEFKDAKKIEFISTQKGLSESVFVVVDGKKKYVLKGVGIPPEFLRAVSPSRQGKINPEKFKDHETIIKTLLKFQYPSQITVKGLSFQVDSSQWNEEKRYKELIESAKNDLKEQSEQNPSLKTLLSSEDLDVEIYKEIVKGRESLEFIEENEETFTKNVQQFLEIGFSSLLHKQIGPYYTGAKNEKIAELVGESLGIEIPKTEIIMTSDQKVFSLHAFVENQGSFSNASAANTNNPINLNEIDLESIQLMFVLDGLIQNHDRNDDNMLRNGNKITLIDHALSLQGNTRASASYVALSSGSINKFLAQAETPLKDEVKKRIADLDGTELLKIINSTKLNLIEDHPLLLNEKKDHYENDLYLRSRIVRAKKMIRTIPNLTAMQFLWGVSSEEAYLQLLHTSLRDSTNLNAAHQTDPDIFRNKLNAQIKKEKEERKNEPAEIKREKTAQALQKNYRKKKSIL